VLVFGAGGGLVITTHLGLSPLLAPLWPRLCVSSSSGSRESQSTKYISCIFEAEFFINGAIKSAALLAHAVFRLPFVKRFALSYRTVVYMSVCVSVCDVGILWPNGWMAQDATLYGGRPRPRRHCVRWGPSSIPNGGTAVSHFLAHVCRF